MFIYFKNDRKSHKNSSLSTNVVKIFMQRNIYYQTIRKNANFKGNLNVKS